ncbi:hypothetical protein C8Q76DRAFT_656923 [Earliella scabrosa]|nr:hypothetical protein C8Q76DRAFT_656923 [Earliella scabrosa]
MRYKPSEETALILRRIIAARWFTRAWCSQELLLSSKAAFFVHDASHPGNVIWIPSEVLWHAMDAARNHDSSIPLFNVPRGSVLATMLSNTTAYALSIIHHLGCSDEYDKISLVCNLVRYTHRFIARPNAFGASAHVLPALRLNVLKMANIMAISRRDFSMLLANHGVDNPLREEVGFGWAGAPLPGDRVSQLWVAKDYEVARDPGVAISQGALVIRGITARIVRELVWEAYHLDGRLEVTIDRRMMPVHTGYPTHYSWTNLRDAQTLKQLMCALAAVSANSESTPETTLHARILLAYLLEEPDYQLQPPPVTGDLSALLCTTFGAPLGSLLHIAKALQFIRRDDGRLFFSTIELSDGSVLLLSGNAPHSALCGRMLFQPFVVRPKLFSPPMVMTANSMILEIEDIPLAPGGSHRCVGCVRGLGMVSEVDPDAERQLRIV